MKFLETLGLENLSNFLTGKEIGTLALTSRIEVYSTKKTTEEKKQTKLLESRIFQEGCRERSESTSSCDPSAVTKDRKTRKLLVDIIRTLTIAHTDYDCSLITADSFEEVSASLAIQQISMQLAELTMQYPDSLSLMWREINEAMGNQLQLCQVYALRDSSFVEEDESVAWSLRYFFCSHEQRRVLYFSCSARSKYRLRQELMQDNMDSDDEGDDQQMAAEEEAEGEEVSGRMDDDDDDSDDAYGWN